MMEFEDDHEEEEEEEEEDEEMAITPPHKPSTDHTNNINSNMNSMIVVKKHMSPTTSTSTRYRECMKNHAVTIGGHAVDGCGEFMPAGAEGTLDSLRCAACNCHRNFHRKEFSDNQHPHQLTIYTPRPHHQPHPPSVSFPFYPYSRTTAAPQATPPPPGPTGYLHVSSGGHPTRPLALPSPNKMHHSSNNTVNSNCVSDPLRPLGDDDEMMGGSGGGMMTMTMSSSSGKKRFRTKFTPEQKDKMLALAEKLGWRIQKQDEPMVQQFCDESGVKRHVLKVWMHNNKHTLGKKP